MKRRWLRPGLLAALCAAALPCLAQAQSQAPAQVGTADTAPHPVQAPHYGDVLFHAFQGDDFGALTALLVSQHFERIAPHDDEAEVLRGGMLLSYGLHQEAAAVFTQLIERGASPAVRDRAWYFLAKVRAQRGLFAEADAALARVAHPLPGTLQDERLLLQAQLRLEQGDNAGAARALQAVASGAPAAAVARFNLGVALVRAGDTAGGRALLDDLGRAPAASEEQRNLRDRANVALGFAALAGGDPARARGLLQRVRLVGPQSNKALLGFGWAAADLQQPQQALVPWTELATRDAGDAAVLEAKIALPSAYAELGAGRRALQGYDDAIALYGSEGQRLQQSIAAIRAGALAAALLQRNPGSGMNALRDMDGVPAMPHADHLATLMAGNAFQEAFKALRDLRFLDHNLADWQQRLGVFDDMLANRRQGYAQRLPAVLQRAGTLDLPALRQRRDALAAALAQARATPSPEAFVDVREQALLARIAEVRSGLAQAGDPVLAERLRRVQGALTWQLAQAFPERAWAATKALRATDQALAEARQHQAALTQAQQDAPARFDAFAARIRALATRLQALRPRLAALDEEQQAALEALAVGTLQAQQQRLQVYEAQARLAKAQLLDRAQLASRTEDADAQH